MNTGTRAVGILRAGRPTPGAEERMERLAGELQTVWCGVIRCPDGTTAESVLRQADDREATMLIADDWSDVKDMINDLRAGAHTLVTVAAVDATRAAILAQVRGSGAR